MTYRTAGQSICFSRSDHLRISQDDFIKTASCKSFSFFYLICLMLFLYSVLSFWEFQQNCAMFCPCHSVPKALHFCFALAFSVFNSQFLQGIKRSLLKTRLLLEWFIFIFSEKYCSHAGDKICIPDMHIALYTCKNMTVNMSR